MRKTIFTKNEYNELKKLISKKVLSDKNEKKKIRSSIRKIGFHFSDFSSKKGYDITDLENLMRSGEIEIQGNNPTVNKSQTNPKKTINPHSNSLSVNVKDPFIKATFVDFNSLSQSTLNETGLYCIRLKSNSKLPSRYQNILNQRSHRIIYMGKAQGQSLRDRLSQEIYHTSPGTFFWKYWCCT